MKNRLAYSTSGFSEKKDKGENGKGNSGFNQEGPCKMRLESKGRGGKAVTVLFSLPCSASEAKRWKQDLQAVCGCGATLKNATIELQGDQRDKIQAWLEKQGIKVVRAGG